MEILDQLSTWNKIYRNFLSALRRCRGSKTYFHLYNWKIIIKIINHLTNFQAIRRPRSMAAKVMRCHSIKNQLTAWFVYECGNQKTLLSVENYRRLWVSSLNFRTMLRYSVQQWRIKTKFFAYTYKTIPVEVKVLKHHCHHRVDKDEQFKAHSRHGRLRMRSSRSKKRKELQLVFHTISCLACWLKLEY